MVPAMAHSVWVGLKLQLHVVNTLFIEQLLVTINKL